MSNESDKFVEGSRGPLGQLYETVRKSITALFTNHGHHYGDWDERNRYDHETKTFYVSDGENVREYTAATRNIPARRVENKYNVHIISRYNVRKCMANNCSERDGEYKPHRWVAWHEDERVCECTSKRELNNRLKEHNRNN